MFYSDNVPTVDALADAPGAPPGDFYDNIATISEVGPEGANSATYTPLPGQPGFSPDHAGLTYLFVSDGTIPVGTAALAFDENGNSAVGTGSLRPDPGPGGLDSVLTYTLAFMVVPGDVLINDGFDLRDVVRFNSVAAVPELPSVILLGFGLASLTGLVGRARHKMQAFLGARERD